MAKFNTVLDEEGQRRREDLASYAANIGSIIDANAKGVQRNNNEFQLGIDSGLVTRLNANLANKDRMERLNAVTNWELARANAAQRNGTEYSGPSPAFEQATRVGGFPPRQVNNAAAPQQNATQPQRATGGGQAIAAENPDQQQQPTAATQPATGLGMMNLVREIPGRDGQPAIGVYRGQHGDVYVQGTPGQPGYGEMQVHGRPQAQGQSRPGLGLGMRDLGNGQVAVGQVDGFQNPGYGFKGSREDAARFFQPVGRPGGYNPYRVDVGPTLFNRLQEERRAAKATSQPAEQGPMGWKRLRDQMNNESRERIAEMTGGFGLTQAGLQDARAREQLAQQYGIDMAQLGNDNLRTQAALGLSGLQQQQAMQQMRQQQMLDSARYTLATADPNSEEYKRAERVAKTYGDGKEKEGQQGKLFNQTNPVTGETTFYWADSNSAREVPITGGQNDGLGAGNFGEEQQKALESRMSKDTRKKFQEALARGDRKGAGAILDAEFARIEQSRK